MTEPTRTLSTGIDVLDRKLDGGIPAGTVVALTASPASQSELFLYEMAGVRDTVYLTTERTDDDVVRELERVGQPADDVETHRLSPDDPLTDARTKIHDLPEGSTLIVDPIDPLESIAEREYREFLNDVRERTVEVEGLTILHCLDGRTAPKQRDRTEYHADVIFNLITRLRGGSVENNLSVPKFRGGESLSDAIELDLTADVTIDVSRKIA